MPAKDSSIRFCDITCQISKTSNKPKKNIKKSNIKNPYLIQSSQQQLNSALR